VALSGARYISSALKCSQENYRRAKVGTNVRGNQKHITFLGGLNMHDEKEYLSHDKLDNQNAAPTMSIYSIIIWLLVLLITMKNNPE
jgi:hypothetical protein